ncbi:hypothetical protein D3C73_1528970 [compost metagenome]
MALQQPGQVIIDIARYADHRIFNGILLLHIGAQVIRRHFQQAFLEAKNRISQRMLPVSGRAHQIMHQIIRRIFAHGYLFEDNILFLRQFFGVHP